MRRDRSSNWRSWMTRTKMVGKAKSIKSNNSEHIFKIIRNSSRASVLAKLLIPKNIRCQVMPDDINFPLTPSLRIRLGEASFCSFFEIDQKKTSSIAFLEDSARSLRTDWETSRPEIRDTIIIAFSEKGVSADLGFSNLLFTHEADGWEELKDNISSWPLTHKIQELIDETVKFYDSNQDIADLLGSSIQTGDSKNVINFLATRLNWGAANFLPEFEVDGIKSLCRFKKVAGSYDDIIFAFSGKSVRGLNETRRLHKIIKDVTYAMHIANKGRVSLAFILGDRDAIVMSPGRPRDMRLYLNKIRLSEKGWIHNTAYLLKSSQIPINPDRNQINIDALLASRELDERFHALCADYRVCLINDLSTNYKSIIADIVNFLRNEHEKEINADKVLVKLASSLQWQDRFLAVVDGLVLRTLVRRFIEVFHGMPFDDTFDKVLERHTDKLTIQRNEVGEKQRGKKSRFINPRVLKSGTADSFRAAFLNLGAKFKAKYGGDMHFTKVAEAIHYVEKQVNVDHLVELLDLTNAQRYSFRYEDLRPDALEHFYQRSLETRVIFQRKNEGLEVVLAESKQARKELGAYYTPAVVSSFVVKNTLGPWIDNIKAEAKQAVENKDYNALADSMARFLDVKVVDPTVGGASFLKEAFRFITSSDNYESLTFWIKMLPNNLLQHIGAKFPWVINGFSQARFEEHVLRYSLYGIDIDLKSLNIASQTLTLESLTFMDQDDRFPNFININLKHGNAFVSLFEQNEWQQFNSRNVASLVNIRRKMQATSDERALLGLQAKFLESKNLLASELLKKRSQQWGFNASELMPFCWQLEFPEVYFDDQGNISQNNGFDIVLGNPPWEVLKPYEEDYFLSVDPSFPTGKNAKAAQRKRISELLKNEEVQQRFEDYLKIKGKYAQFLDNSKQYLLQDPKYENVGGGNGDPNTYKLASEIYPKLVNNNGKFGFLVPEGIAGDKGTRDLRGSLIKCKSLRLVVAFEKENEIFPDATQSFCILLGGGANDSYQYLRGLSRFDQITDLDLGKYPTLNYNTLSKIKLETQPLIAIKNSIEAGILDKILQFNSPVESDEPFQVHAYRELDTTNDMDLTTGSHTPGYYVCKGEHMGRFKSPSATEYKLNYAELKKRKHTWAHRVNEIRVAWRNIAGSNDPRRMFAAIIPPKYSCFNSLNVITGFKNENQAYYLIGVLNSFCYEYFIQMQSKNNNINIYFVKLNPLPRLKDDDYLFKKVSALSKKLSTSKNDGNEELVEAQLEAAVAEIYGFSKEEFSWILSTFKRVDEAYREIVLNEFINRSLYKRSAA